MTLRPDWVSPSAALILADLTTAGYVVKHKHGRRNRYQIGTHLPPSGPFIGDVLAVLVGDGAGHQPFEGQRLPSALGSPSEEQE